MNIAKMRASELAEFESIVCADCINRHRDNDSDGCFIQNSLTAVGESDCVYELDTLKNGCRFKCMMKITDFELGTERIIRYIDESRTEEVLPILEKIESSYHYDVIKGIR